MHCPKCNYFSTKVYDSRLTSGGKSTKRRRQCLQCQYRFTTVEEIQVLDLNVEKRNGQIQAFDYSKLENGIKKAFNKRSIDVNKLSFLVQKITEDILATKRNPIKSTKIGRLVLKNLREVDEAAYICFWAMFGNFDSVEDFNKKLKDMQKNG